MEKAKKNTKTKAVTKEPEVQIPKRYEVNIYKKREPIAKDILAGRYGYWESTNELKLLEYTDNFGADIEGILEGDIVVDGTGISVHNSPKDWIQNLHKTNIGFGYIASEAVVLNETE